MKRFTLCLLAVAIVSLCYLGFTGSPLSHHFENSRKYVDFNGPLKESNTRSYPADIKESLFGFTKGMPVDHPGDNIFQPALSPLLRAGKWAGTNAADISLAGARVHIPQGAMSLAAFVSVTALRYVEIPPLDQG